MEKIDNPLAPRLRVLFGHAIALGPGKTHLLELIAETGSISAAARRMNMSYRRAWLLVDTMNRCFRSPLIETATGGKGGGGAHITGLGQEILRRYREMETKAIAATKEDMEAISNHFSDIPPENPH
ncbi:MAG: LysR family transcriptional regulator [Sulfuricellaceae bacterium]